ncbi:MAG: RNA-binding protein [Patescibacteria group bacterium]|jgi:RNA recognition motif-containing protein
MDQGNKLYVGNLPYSVDQTKLQALFEVFGELTEVVVISDRFSGKSKGFGFVTFKNAADAEKALKEMNEKEVDGRKLMVSVARPKKEFKERKSF